MFPAASWSGDLFRWHGGASACVACPGPLPLRNLLFLRTCLSAPSTPNSTSPNPTQHPPHPPPAPARPPTHPTPPHSRQASGFKASTTPSSRPSYATRSRWTWGSRWTTAAWTSACIPSPAVRRPGLAPCLGWPGRLAFALAAPALADQAPALANECIRSTAVVPALHAGRPECRGCQRGAGAQVRAMEQHSAHRT